MISSVWNWCLSSWSFMTCYSLLFIVLILFSIGGYRCATCGRRPSIDKIIVLFAFAQGLNFAFSIFMRAIKLLPTNEDIGAGLLLAALVTWVGAAYGVYDLIKSIEPRYIPKRILIKRKN